MMEVKKKLGFGLMRLPKQDGQIDIETVGRMADLFLQRGFTYFDTAYVYDGSEDAFRKAVVERHPRESFTIADKLPCWSLSEENTPGVIFQESLRRCGVDYFDYYLLHNVKEDSAPVFEQYGCWEFVRRMKEKGKIRHIGFSCHGKPSLLRQVLQAHPEVEFVQLQINYLDWESEAICSRENYEIARSFGKDIVIMEPIKGGTLSNLRPDARAVLSDAGMDASPSSYALRFAASLDGVKVVLSGMGAEAQVQENLSAFTGEERRRQGIRLRSM